MLIDTHTHLFSADFSEDLSAVIERAQAAEVEKLFLPNIDDDSIEQLLAICSRYPNCCYPMLGLHPTSVDANYQQKLKVLHSYLKESHPFVAIGEVGLDLYWDKSYAKEQEQALHTQIAWALEYDLPLVIHCRSAHAELVTLLKSYEKESLSGVFHSFGGTVDEAQELLEYPYFYLGINGTVTFKNSQLPANLKQIALERIVLETDSPYLSPVPYRGSRNESSRIKNIANKLSDINEVSENVVASITTLNALKLFKMNSKALNLG
ncbi:MAG: TatD family hydrolase [Phocaeicola sp.]